MRNCTSVLALFAAFVMALVNAAGVSADTIVYNIATGQGRTSDQNPLPADDVHGAAPENTANSTWNGVEAATNDMALKTSTGADSPVRLTTSNLGGGSETTYWTGEYHRLFSFYTWGGGPYAISFTGLNARSTYDLLVYGQHGWYDGDKGLAISQTAGTGLSGTFTLNANNNGIGMNAYVRDTDASNTPGNFNYVRLDGLASTSGGALSFSIAGINGGPMNGIQLVEHVAEGTIMIVR